MAGCLENDVEIDSSVVYSVLCVAASRRMLLFVAGSSCPHKAALFGILSPKHGNLKSASQTESIPGCLSDLPRHFMKRKTS
ncbi:hypothetical protein RRG08_051997 [Elysia crispata]|uniref:Uncharacterized protein n=1 Tax=Elysia crispata TaxID=231223 RepID=A0AAE0ZCD7_9GAST|nr:hypothetical protein RRG08_051997 [Elysia crispata]